MELLYRRQVSGAQVVRKKRRQDAQKRDDDDADEHVRSPAFHDVQIR
jgi:hypothetical protein